MPFAALEPALCGKIPGVGLVADRAGHYPIRPAHLDHISMAPVGIREELNGRLQGFGGLQARGGFHTQELTKARLLSQLYYYRSTWNIIAQNLVDAFSGGPYAQHH